MFRDWLILGRSSCVSLTTAANVRLYLNVAVSQKKIPAVFKNWFIFYLQMYCWVQRNCSFSSNGEVAFSQRQFTELQNLEYSCTNKLYKNKKINISSTFLSLAVYIFMAGKINGYTPIPGKNTENYCNYKFYKSRKADSDGRELPSRSFLPGFFSIFRRKMYGPNPSQMDIKVLIPEPAH